MPSPCRPSRAPASSACAGPPTVAAAARHPCQPSDPRPRRDPRRDSIFERALAHVLEMEGGYDEDPYDPGGPTNLGITLAEFARDKGVELTSANFAAAEGRAESHPARHGAPHLPRRLLAGRRLSRAAAAARALPLRCRRQPGRRRRRAHAAAGRRRRDRRRDRPADARRRRRPPLEETLAAYADVRRRRYRSLPDLLALRQRLARPRRRHPGARREARPLHATPRHPRNRKADTTHAHRTPNPPPHPPPTPSGGAIP